MINYQVSAGTGHEACPGLNGARSELTGGLQNPLPSAGPRQGLSLPSPVATFTEQDAIS